MCDIKELTASLMDLCRTRLTLWGKDKQTAVFGGWLAGRGEPSR